MQKLSFQWDIKNFNDCDLVFQEFFDSPRFFTTDPTFKSDWKLRLYPAGGIFKETRKDLALLLLRSDSGSNLHIKHSISLLNRIRNQIYTESCLKLREPSKFNSTMRMMEATNIVEIKKNVNTFLDGGVLSILCEIEIYEKNEEMKMAVPEKHFHMHGISWVIRNMYSPVNVTISTGGMEFFLPHGKFVLLLRESSLFMSGRYNISFEIIDEVHTEIKEVPITIVFDKNKSTWNIKRSKSYTIELYSTAAQSIQISTRCMVESPLDAVLMDITSFVQKIQADFRNMFLQSEGGDISIAVDGKTLRVHKNILSSRCPVFAAMFSQEWSEQTSQTVTIKNFDYKTVLAMMEFIYFGGGHDDYEDEGYDPIELLRAAHMYQLDDMKNKIEQRLCESLKKNNVATYMVLAENYDLPILQIEAIQFMTLK